ncbi:MAG: hypothetical protein NW224_25670 [Leptolyngbyaceae cyanobacterium bins.302]|nr:hypothetical protein [Leptolyngbyaceae cyanobacterium bins.302]
MYLRIQARIRQGMERQEQFDQQLDVKIHDANDKLRNANVWARIQRMGGKLYLRATLPPKSDSNETCYSPQRISLGISASLLGLIKAEKEARKVAALLDCKEFSWQPYLMPQHKPPEAVAE